MDLISRIAELQQEKWKLEEKVISLFKLVNRMVI